MTSKLCGTPSAWGKLGYVVAEEGWMLVLYPELIGGNTVRLSAQLKGLGCDDQSDFIIAR